MLAGGLLREGPLFAPAPHLPRVKATPGGPHPPRTLSCMELAVKTPMYTSMVGGVRPGQGWDHFLKGFKAVASKGVVTQRTLGTGRLLCRMMRFIQVSAVGVGQHLPRAPSCGAGRPHCKLLEGSAEGEGYQAWLSHEVRWVQKGLPS